MACKLCNNEHMSTFLDFEKYPGSISFLYDNSEDAIKDSKRVRFLKCDNCQHIQLSEDTPQSFYEEYVMTVSHSKKMNDFQNDQANFFVDKYNLKGKSILEVGCGDGNFLSILQHLGCNVLGNEPSKPFREMAVSKGFTVDDKFINDEYTNPNAPFDAVLAREVMEHVPDPVNFLKNIYKIVKPGGVALIEIPNAEKTHHELRYYDFFTDHISYFTKDTLTLVMLISGFRDIEIYYGMDDEFMYAIGRKEIIENTSLNSALSNIQNDFTKLQETYNNLVVWGAGGKGIAALGSLHVVNKIKYVVDSDPLKQGKYLPSSGLLVKSPNELFNDAQADALVITNLAYTDEIIQILNTNNFKGKVYVLSKTGISEIV